MTDSAGRSEWLGCFSDGVEAPEIRHRVIAHPPVTLVTPVLPNSETGCVPSRASPAFVSEGLDNFRHQCLASG